MAEIALLDGGNGQEIVRRSGKSAHPLWSLKVMFDTPDVIADVHSSFIEAGARIITLNTYAATPTRLERDGFGVQLDDAHATAITLAQTARAATGTEGTVQIAGCIPPLVASFRADVSKSYDDSLPEYRRIVAAQAESVDLFLIETMSNIAEASAALDAVQESGKPAFIGLTLSEDLSATLRSGEPLQDAIATLAARHPDGIFLNCSSPEAITHALPILAAAGVRFGAYANGFTSVDALMPGGVVDSLLARQDLTPETYADFVDQWIAMGATFVGGCCEVGPAHIRCVADRLAAAGHVLGHLGKQTT